MGLIILEAPAELDFNQMDAANAYLNGLMR
jgi:hypothetical protein